MKLKYFSDRVLSRLGWSIRVERHLMLPSDVEERFRTQFIILRQECPKFTAVEKFQDDSTDHPMHYRGYECEFASEQIAKIKPMKLFDVRSYREWLSGLMAHYSATTIE